MTVRLTVSGLNVAFPKRRTLVPVVHEVDLSLEAGETLAVVGESGSGKSVSALALMRLLPPEANVTGKVILHDGDQTDLLRLNETAMRKVRGNRIAMIFQEPLSCLNPVYRIGTQICEAIRCHKAVSSAEAWRMAEGLLEQVGIPEPGKRLRSFPHELSGGMRQRVMIAIAIALEPKVLIADEPTTALDVTIQAQILDLLRELQTRNGMSILFITHDFGVVSQIADRTAVMYSGRIVEQAPVSALLDRPLMPYSHGLMGCVPRLAFAGLTRDEDLRTIDGFIPDPGNQPPGCAFHPRCEHMRPDICQTRVPQLEDATADRQVRCFRWREIEGAQP